MTDKEYVGLSVGGTVERRQGAQEVCHKVQLSKVFLLMFVQFLQLAVYRKKRLLGSSCCRKGNRR